MTDIIKMSITNIKNKFPTFDITVITIMFNSDIDTKNFVDIFTDIYTNTEIDKSESESKFYNCIKLKLSLKNSKNISLKYFKNGKIHITGIKDFESIQEIRELLVNKFPNNYISEHTICMINSHISFNKELCLEELKNKINTYENITAIYQPCRYHGLKVKYKNSKILIFTSGSMCVISKSLDDIYETLRNIYKLIFIDN